MSTAPAAPPTAPSPDGSPQRRGAARSCRPLLFEVAWEVCRQLGGIYQVLRSKVPAMDAQWGVDYCMVGPYEASSAAVEFEEQRPPPPMRRVIETLAGIGTTAHFGRWLVSGRPRVVLLEHGLPADEIGMRKYFLWRDHGLELSGDGLLDDVVGFSDVVNRFFEAVVEAYAPRPIVAHFHEWMGSLAIPGIRRAHLPIGIVFTTHATRLGRQLAGEVGDFYERLPRLDDAAEAARYGLGAIHGIERACAHGAHVFTTVSEVTGEECRYLLGRAPDIILPNGLNIERFVAAHYLHSLHLDNRRQIDRFVRGHFFPYYSFDLDNTLYLFTSGRYEPRNKGFDLCLEAAARLNSELKARRSSLTVVFFIISRRDGARISSQCLQSSGVMRELEDTCQAITREVGPRFFNAVTTGDTPSLDGLVSDYWRLRLRRTTHAWRRRGLPPVITHDVAGPDPVLDYIRALWLDNSPDHPVKVVYHPEFITPANPLWKMEYDQFVRGCHLGVFPSVYEPWGYTPLECLASGIPSVSSDLAGFGRYVMSHFPDHNDWGAYVIRRRSRSYPESAAELTRLLLAFCALGRRDRIALRNRVDEHCTRFDWSALASAYAEAHDRALEMLAGA